MLQASAALMAEHLQLQQDMKAAVSVNARLTEEIKKLTQQKGALENLCRALRGNAGQDTAAATAEGATVAG